MEQDETLWFAWYPVITDKGLRWLITVWWSTEPGYVFDGYHLYTKYYNRYRVDDDE